MASILLYKLKTIYKGRVMPISDLCPKSLVSIEKGATIKSAAQLMKKHHIGGVVVVDSKGKNKPLGLITDRDIAMGITGEKLTPETKVQDLMSKEVFKVSKDMGIADVVDKMESKGVRRMVVVDESDNACGVVSSDDILQLVARELYGLGKLVEGQSKAEKAH